MLFDYVGRASELARRGLWEQIETAGLETADAVLPKELLRQIENIDLEEYEALLKTAIESLRGLVKKKTKALYWEFDPDYGWSSNFTLTQSFDLLGTEWATDEHGHTEGPPLESFAGLYQASRGDTEKREAVLTALAARTFAAFGRAYEQAGFFERPMGAAIHGSDTILQMPRPDIDIDELYRKAEARLFKLPAGEWLVMGDRGRIGGTSIAGNAHAEDQPLSGRDLRHLFPNPAPIGDWTPPLLQVRNGALTDLLPDVRGPGVFSTALRNLVDQERTSTDKLEWLPAKAIDADGKEVEYWYLHFTSEPPPLRRAIRGGKRGDFEAEVLDHEACAERRILPYQKGYKELGWFVVHRSLAEKVVEKRLRDIGWNQYWTTRDRATKEILD